MNSGRWIRCLLIGSVALPAMLFSATTWHERNAEIADIGSQERGIVALASEQIRQTIISDKIVLSVVGDRIVSEGTFLSDGIVHDMVDKLGGLEEISAIFVTDANGAVISSSRTRTPTVSVADSEFFREAKSDPDPNRVHIVSGLTRNNSVIVLAKRLPSSDNAFRGVIAICVDQKYFDNLLDASKRNSEGMFVLATPDGRVISRAPHKDIPSKVLPNSVIAAIRTNPNPILVYGLAAAATSGPAALTRIVPGGLIIGYALDAGLVNKMWFGDILPSGMLLLVGLIGISGIGLIALRGHAREELGHLRLHEETRRRHSIEEKMHHLQRMEAIGQLTAGVAHDFNNMLTAISANAEFLERSPDEKQRQRAIAILGAVERGAKLIRQMLTFARRQVLQATVLDINDELRGFSSLLSSAIAGHLVVEYRLSEERLLCSVDPSELELAVLNITTNAIHAMPSGGKLVIETSTLCVTETEPDLRTGMYVVINITDHGSGMSADVLEHAFEPFFTTRPLGEGSGLGLSQVFGFAKQAGGCARITSMMGSGTTVSIFLPVSRHSVAPTEERAFLNEPAKVKILVVDDTEDVLTVVADALEAHGFVPTACTKASDALRKLEFERFDVLITDIIMPGGMSGIDLAAAAREKDRAIKIMLMTGYSDQTISGGLPLLLKPFNMGELINRVELLLKTDASRRWN